MLINRAQLTPDYMKKLNVQFNGGKAFVPGADYAGTVHSAGKNSKWTVGQEVHGMNMDITGGKSGRSHRSRSFLKVVLSRQETVLYSNTSRYQLPRPSPQNHLGCHGTKQQPSLWSTRRSMVR